jgi:deoxyribonuclease V
MRHDIEKLRGEQKRISESVVVEDRLPRRIRTIGGFDIGYSRSKAKVAGVVLDYGNMEIIEKKVIETSISFPYVPTFLTFREGPPLIEVYRKLRNKPDVLMFNGHGTSHPLRAGLASHVVAQGRLVGEYEDPKDVDDFSKLMLEGEQVGWVLLSKAKCRPIFVSPGHMVSMRRALSICLYCLGERKLPEPLALAHDFAK